MTDNVIQFPKPKPKKETRRGIATDIDENLSGLMSVSADALDMLVASLVEEGYDPLKSPEMIMDLGIILNATYAMLLRDQGIYHVLHDHMEEMQGTLEELTRMMKANKDIFDPDGER
jgi:hypothetical protein